MRVRRLAVAGLFAISIVSMLGEVARAQFGSLTARIPGDANAIVILNVEKVLASPLAVEQNWREKQENASAAGVTVLPPSAQQFLMAAHMDLEFMQPVWEIAMASLRYDASIPKVAARWGGDIDRIAERSCVSLPDDSYVVQFGPKLIGAYRPGSRQSVLRWLKSTDVSGDRISPYIAEAINYAQKVGTPIIMALDLEGVLSQEFLKKRLTEMESLKGHKIDVDQWAKALASIRGVTLGITIKEKIYGAIKVDFDEDVSFLGELAQPMLLEALANHGAMIDEFESWTTKLDGKRIQIGGPIYRSGMQRILSVLDVPSSLQLEEKSPGEAPTKEELAKLSSQQYFKSVVAMIDDLRSKPASGKTKSINQYGTWFSRYADKIDKLPIVNVDPELLDFGLYVSTSFRSAGESVRSSGGRARVNALEAPNTYAYYGRWGPNGGYGGYVQDVKAVQADRTRIRTEERVSTATDVRGIMQAVMQASADVRIKMTQKYNAEF